MVMFDAAGQRLLLHIFCSLIIYKRYSHWPDAPCKSIAGWKRISREKVELGVFRLLHLSLAIAQTLASYLQHCQLVLQEPR